jgi:hypothetical protein
MQLAKKYIIAIRSHNKKHQENKRLKLAPHDTEELLKELIKNSYPKNNHDSIVNIW